jgi:hypothetical protein
MRVPFSTIHFAKRDFHFFFLAVTENIEHYFVARLLQIEDADEFLERSRLGTIDFQDDVLGLETGLRGGTVRQEPPELTCLCRSD